MNMRYGASTDIRSQWATQGLSLHAKEFAKSFAEGGMPFYMKEVAAPAIAGMATDKNGRPTARGDYLADSFFDVVSGIEITDVLT